MMSGLENGVNDNSTMVVSAFSIMFNAVLALCTNNTELMKASLVCLPPVYDGRICSCLEQDLD